MAKDGNRSDPCYRSLFGNLRRREEVRTHVPRSSDIVIAPVNEGVEPALRYRSWSGNTRARPAAVFPRRHGMGRGGRPFVGHFVQHWWRLYGEEHPDWFAMNAQGKRVGSSSSDWGWIMPRPR